MRGKNIHGAPYDFRKAANEHQDYFARLKSLIEKTYKNVILKTKLNQMIQIFFRMETLL